MNNVVGGKLIQYIYINIHIYTASFGIMMHIASSNDAALYKYDKRC